MHRNPNPKHRLRVVCSATVCTANLDLRDGHKTTVASDTWTVHGSKVTLRAPAAIPRFLASDRLHGCTARYFAVVRDARTQTPGANVEQAELRAALKPCGSTV